MMRKLPVFFAAVWMFWSGIFMTPGTLMAQHPMGTFVETISRIEERKASWIAFRADLVMSFLTREGEIASCGGELFYQKLDERILLKCTNAEGKLLFVFRTEDKFFELYLPARSTAFQGNIFDLDDSLEIESHLKPLDLYRALKPAAFPSAETIMKEWNREEIRIQILGRWEDDPYLAREMVASLQGDVKEETYYSPLEEPTLIIRREGFRKISPKKKGGRNAVIFPEHVNIESPETGEMTSLFFKSIRFSPSFESEAWTFPLPEGTQVVTIDVSPLKQLR